MLNDIRFSFRQIVKSPGFAGIAILTLAIGIGANTAIFSLINAILLNPLPYPDSERLVSIQQDTGNSGNALAPYSGGLYMDLEDRTTQFESIAYTRIASLSLTGNEVPMRLNGLEVSANYLRTFGIKPALGRDFSPESEQPGGDARVVILSDHVWRNQFSADPGIINRRITLDYQSYTVIGVIPPESLLFTETDFLAPGAIRATPWKQAKRYDYVLNITARLKNGATIDSAQAELETLKANSISEYPEVMKEWGISVTDLQESVMGSYKPYAMTLLIAVGMVLLVACSNVANLLLARASARQSELALRSALGAPGWKIARQLLVESTLLATLGGVMGLVLGIVALKPLAFVVGLEQLPNTELEIDSSVLLFTLSISILTGLIFGALPAWKAVRLGIANGLSEATRSSTSAKSKKTQSALIITEVALTVVLLVSIGLLLKSFTNAFKTDPGFNQANILTFEIQRSSQRSPKPADLVRFTDQVIERIEQVPGVESAAMVSSIPMNGFQTYGGELWRDDLPQPKKQYFAGFDAVNGDYFQAMEIPLLNGRLFERADQNKGAHRVLVVNERVVQDLFPKTDPIGKIVRDDTGPWEIVGVVGNISPYGLDQPVAPYMYRPQGQWPWKTAYIVKTKLPPLALAKNIEAAVLAVDSLQPIDRVRTLESIVSKTLSGRVIMISLIGLFGVIATFLAAIGIYGLMSYLVEQRTREFGIRLSIGALPKEIVGMVFKRALILTAIGLAIGIALVIALGRYLAFILYQVEPYDPIVLAAVSFLTLIITLFACWKPARDASKVLPSVALRLD